MSVLYKAVNVYTIHCIHCSIKYCLLGMGFNGIATSHREHVNVAATGNDKVST